MRPRNLDQAEALLICPRTEEARRSLMFDLSEKAKLGIVSGAVGVLILMVICMICKLKRLNNPLYKDNPMFKGPHHSSQFSWQRKLSSGLQCSDCMRERHLDMYNNALQIRGASFSPRRDKGTLVFSLLYQMNFKTLIARVIKGCNLVGRDFWEPVDSYVRVKLEPDTEHIYKGQTKILRKEANPVYNETFQFSIELQALMGSVAFLSVWEIDKYSRHHVIGQVEVKLGHVMKPDKILSFEQGIREPSKARAGSGELLFSLSYLPTAERLSVVIMKARNLRAPFSEWRTEPRPIDPYVKVVLLFDGQKIKKKKSSTRRQESNPVYNEAMLFDVPPHFLHRIIFIIAVADKTSDKTRSDIIGRVVIGSPSSGEALSHWHQMLVSPRRPVAAWHKLKL